VGEWLAARSGRTLTPGKDPVPILQEAGWAPGPVWTGGKSRLHRDSIPDRPARCQPLYRLSYRAHVPNMIDKQRTEEDVEGCCNDALSGNLTQKA
jgi:hypothetical protein